MAKELWVEKYRPNKMADYVFRDEKQRQQISEWIKNKSIPHILLSGTQGIGKTSLINVLLSEIEVLKGDRLYINASEETSIDVIRNKVLGFATTIAWGDFKVVILEEAEQISQAGQAALKRIIEDYSDSCRFLLTSNNPHKIIPPIISRLQTFHMTSLNKEDFQYRLAYILAEENIDFDLETLDSFIAATYPDLRKAINSAQLNSVDGKLLSPSSDSGSKTDIMIKAIELFKSGNITSAREFICENADYNDYPEIYMFLYRNLDLFGSTDQQKEDVLLEIRNAIVNDAVVAQREINLAACLVRLRQIKN